MSIFMIPMLAMVKTLNFGTTILTRLKILKIGNSYRFHVQSNQKITILAKNLILAQNFDFYVTSWFPD